MSEYGELSPNDGSEENQLTGNYDIEKGEIEKKKKTYTQKQMCLSNLCLLFIFLVIYILYICYPLFYVDYDDLSFDYNLTQDIVESNLSNDISASVHPIHYHRRKTCDDFEYGCCVIHFKCKIRDNYLDYEDYKLSPYRIIAKDRIKSNCPSLDSLVHLWNIHYKTEACENSKFGCCPPINTGCDFSLKNKRENNQETIEFYQQNILHSHRITVPKKDKIGTNCPGERYGHPIYDIIYGYNNNYPDPYSDTTLFIIIVVICLFFLISSL